MASNIWRHLEADVATIFQKDGEQLTIITASGTYGVIGFWDGLSLEEGEQGGERAWVAAADLPSDFTQGDTLSYEGVTYTVSHRAPDGHGMEALTLWGE